MFTLPLPLVVLVAARAIGADTELLDEAPPADNPAPASKDDATVMPTVRARASAESDATGKDSVRANTTGIAKGRQPIRDVPQSMIEKAFEMFHLNARRVLGENGCGEQ